MTITTEIARNLGHFRNLTIITSALNIASMLAEYEGVNIFMPGRPGIFVGNQLVLICQKINSFAANQFLPA